jgi:Protein of unknown function (DUF551)
MTVDWISVEERLPGINRPVLVWCGCCSVAIRRNVFEGCLMWSSVPGAMSVYPTHWAELPEGPKE